MLDMFAELLLVSILNERTEVEYLGPSAIPF